MKITNTNAPFQIWIILESLETRPETIESNLYFVKQNTLSNLSVKRVVEHGNNLNIPIKPTPLSPPSSLSSGQPNTFLHHQYYKHNLFWGYAIYSSSVLRCFCGSAEEYMTCTNKLILQLIVLVRWKAEMKINTIVWTTEAGLSATQNDFFLWNSHLV